MTEASDATVVEIASDADVVRVRQLVRGLAVRAGLSLVDQTKLITASSELARNTLVYGGGGRAIVQCAPYTLPKEQYASWKLIETRFGLKELR